MNDEEKAAVSLVCPKRSRAWCVKEKCAIWDKTTGKCGELVASESLRDIAHWLECINAFARR